MTKLHYNFCYIFSLIMLSSHFIYGQDTKFAIIGSVSGKDTLKSIKLIKYISHFEDKYIADIPVVDNKFYYENNKINEIDAYIIRHPNSPNLDYWFIWDGEVEMKISNSNFYPTSIKSPLTALRDSCSDFLNKTYFDKVRELDKLISQERAHKKDGTRIVELEKQKSIASEAAKEGLHKFRENFIRSNPNSFLSLYYLTESGFESDDAWHIEMFKLLSDDLKKHSRAKVYR